MANFQLGDTQKVSYAISEVDADGNPASPQPGDVVSVISGDINSATITQDATPVAGSIASGFIVGGSKEAVGLTITATVAHADGTSFKSVTLIDIIGGPATGISLTLGAPVNQGAAAPPPPPAGSP